MSRIITRAEWGHPGPVGPPMRLPAQKFYIHHSVTAFRNGPPYNVAQIGIQRFGRSSYSYAITPDGVIWEMQGTHIGAHTGGQNSTSFGVVFVGNYDGPDRPTDAQIEAFGWLYRHHRNRGWVVSNARILGHRDAPQASTACPGRFLYARLPHIRQVAANGAPIRPQEDEMTPALKAHLEGMEARIQDNVARQVTAAEDRIRNGRALGKDSVFLREGVREVLYELGVDPDKLNPRASKINV